jgi:hypothetical protein
LESEALWLAESLPNIKGLQINQVSERMQALSYPTVVAGGLRKNISQKSTLISVSLGNGHKN